MKLSEQIELLIEIISESVADYEWNKKTLNDCDAEQQNLLHEFEGIKEGCTEVIPPSDAERRKIGTRMTRCRCRRRAAKDLMKVSFALSNFAKSDSGKTFLNSLKNVLGETRKAEATMESRRYYERDVNSAPTNIKLEQAIKKVVKNRKKGKK